MIDRCVLRAAIDATIGLAGSGFPLGESLASAPRPELFRMKRQSTSDPYEILAVLLGSKHLEPWHGGARSCRSMSRSIPVHVAFVVIIAATVVV